MRLEEIVRQEPPLKLINMELVEVEEIKWLLYPFIPYGKVTIIQGDPGEGKTTMVLQIIAKLTRGEPILPASFEKRKNQKEQMQSPMKIKQIWMYLKTSSTYNSQ